MLWIVSISIVSHIVDSCYSLSQLWMKILIFYPCNLLHIKLVYLTDFIKIRESFPTFVLAFPAFFADIKPAFDLLLPSLISSNIFMFSFFFHGKRKRKIDASLVSFSAEGGKKKLKIKYFSLCYRSHSSPTANPLLVATRRVTWAACPLSLTSALPPHPHQHGS